MKKTICFLMLVSSITGISFAQNQVSNTDKTFDLSPSYASLRFIIDLGKGNKLQIELRHMDDLKKYTNMDSVIRVLLADLEPLKDSLGDEASSRRIDYRTDSTGIKKIRIQLFKPKGSSFLLNANDVAVLKLEQDTVNLLGSITYQAKVSFRKAYAETRYYRISFFVNDLSDLATYMDGSLNKKIQALLENNSSSWITTIQKGTE